jgi:hypothetical protein
MNFTTAAAMFASAPGVLSVAFSHDPELVEWQEFGSVLTNASLPEGYGGIIDGLVWINSSWYDTTAQYLALVSTCVDTCNSSSTAAFLLFSSSDFITWTFVQEFFRTTGVIGSPQYSQLFDLTATETSGTVLMFSDDVSTLWFVGDVVHGTFSPLRSGVVDAGVLTNAISFVDDIGRRLMFGWIPEERPFAESLKAGWANVLSFPRVITLNSDKSLSFLPAQEVSDMQQPETTCLSNPIQYGMDYPGGDYTNVNLTGVESPLEVCQALCCQQSECVLWAFVYKQPANDWNCNLNDDCCWLKSVMFPSNPNPIVMVCTLACDFCRYCRIIRCVIVASIVCNVL